MTEKQEKIMYFTTHGGEEPEKASIPFVMANAALSMDIHATIVMQENSVYLAKEEYRKTVLSTGEFPHITKLMDDFLALGGELLVCVPCIKSRHIDESELPEGARTTAAGQLNVAAIEADAVFTY